MISVTISMIREHHSNDLNAPMYATDHGMPKTPYYLCHAYIDYTKKVPIYATDHDVPKCTTIYLMHMSIIAKITYLSMPLIMTCPKCPTIYTMHMSIIATTTYLSSPLIMTKQSSNQP